jgi:hypothetical protein
MTSLARLRMTRLLAEIASSRIVGNAAAPLDTNPVKWQAA